MISVTPKEVWVFLISIRYNIESVVQLVSL